MGLQIAHMVFDAGFPFRLPRGWRQNNDVIEILQVRKHGVEDKLILGMLRDSCFQIVWDEIFWYSTVELQRMNDACDEA